MNPLAAVNRSPALRLLCAALRLLLAAWAAVLRHVAHRGRTAHVAAPTVDEGATVGMAITHRASVHITAPDGWTPAQAEAAGRDAFLAAWAQTDGAPWR